MGDHLEKSVDTALTVTTQLITLSTALIPVAVALVELRYPNGTPVPALILQILLWALIFDVLSILGGIAVYAATTDALRLQKDMDVMYMRGPRFSAVWQWTTFLVGASLTVAASILAVG